MDQGNSSSDDNVDTAVGAQLTRLITIRGYTLKTLSNETMIQEEDILAFQNGTRRISPQQIRLLAKTLNVSVKFFFEGAIDHLD